ncbi:UPF0182 family protein [Methanoculleus sp. FWC-SCC1]|uniref:UPF0182 protein FGU65_12620 n=1 Tax=Methanoculleus frigidifontis TaxID=2584085 RepID=A0ABT8MCP7_9EURY|nr:UPF0182 family protein [Methanoculleus sp. FWC-SCC1]MDN7025713.1 UPF0182 family protein [Methanoculleus sp. FWC-SCC1]
MRPSTLVILGLAGVAIAVSIAVGVLADWFWFGAVGYESVYLTVLAARVGLGVLGFLVFFAVSYGNAAVAARTAGQGTPLVAGLIAAVGSLLAGIVLSGAWETVLLFFNQTAFLADDPIFGLDIGFYVFALPFYTLIVNFLLGLFLFAAVLAGAAFLIRALGIELEPGRQPAVTAEPRGWQQYARAFLPHLSVLLFLVFAALAVRLWLARYGILFSTTGAVYGAGYTAVNVTLPVLTVLAALALVIGIGFLINAAFGRIRVIAYGLAAFVGVALIGLVAVAAVQGLIVAPDEFNLEREYLGYNIQHTRAAYDLDEVDDRFFPVALNLTAEDIRENNATISNIRLWDWRPLQATYAQLQLFRTYYDFFDVDVDRYTLDGRYREVLVSARELNVGLLPEQAQTWVNRHLIFTHGYGAVMNPVDQVTPEGLPVFYLRDIPPVAQFENLTVTEPAIYYGEETGNYVVTQTTTAEFDYPSGEQNVYTRYGGTGGVPLSDGLRRLVYAVRFGSIELLVSGSITPESRVLLYRNAAERAAAIAPFLSYDPDPYVVVDGGKIFWIIDAYTTSLQYPYAEPTATEVLDGGRTNYIRNSVKVVVDAYTGDVAYYVVDPDDPLIAAYEKIFPGLFRGIGEMPAGLRDHIRYPQGIFQVQANVYALYHMQDPLVFYNKEDAWVIPDEIYRGARQPMVPYYVILRLPGETDEEFILMLPFTPRNKENMIGWMAARCDAPKYGDLVVFRFSKQELTYGPMQVEARIDQDPEISQAITLWSQAGSDVLRGNTLVIPIENSIIYIEPLYLEATERGTLPQLRRVIVAYGDMLTMQETLNQSLAVIFGEGGEAPPGEVPAVGGDLAERLARISDLFDAAEQALSEGDLGRYQEQINEIGQVASP